MAACGEMGAGMDLSRRLILLCVICAIACLCVSARRQADLLLRWAFGQRARGAGLNVLHEYAWGAHNSERRSLAKIISVGFGGEN